MSLHYLVKYECQKNGVNLCIVSNDKSQGSIAKHLRCDELLYYTFIIQLAGKRIFKIGEHLAKLQAKWSTVSCTIFALHFCPQRCRSRQISWITCVRWTDTITNHAMLIGRLIHLLSKMLNCCRPVLTYWLTDWHHQWLTDCWSYMAFCSNIFSLLRQLCTVGYGIFYVADVNIFLLVK